MFHQALPAYRPVGDISTVLGTGMGLMAVVWLGISIGGLYLLYKLVSSDTGKEVAKLAILKRI